MSSSAMGSSANVNGGGGGGGSGSAGEGSGALSCSELPDRAARGVVELAGAARGLADALRGELRGDAPLARAAATPGNAWRAYRAASAPWSFVLRRAASAFGAEALLASVTVAHCVAAGAALVATPVVFMFQSDAVRKATTDAERRYLRERRTAAALCGALLPVSFVVATARSWQRYAHDDDVGALSWAFGVPVLHCAFTYGISALVSWRHTILLEELKEDLAEEENGGELASKKTTSDSDADWSTPVFPS